MRFVEISAIGLVLIPLLAGLAAVGVCWRDSHKKKNIRHGH